MSKVKINDNAGILEYKGYFGSVEFSLEDNCLHGKLLGLEKIYIAFEGQTLDELKADFKAAVDGYLEDCMQDNIKPEKPFSGILHVKLSPEMHLKAVIQAKKKGESLDVFVRHAVENVLYK